MPRLAVKLRDRQFLKRFFIFLACAAGVTICASYALTPQIVRMAQVMKNGSETVLQRLPESSPGGVNEIRQYRVELQVSPYWRAHRLNLMADDCLREFSINQHPVHLPTPVKCRWDRGNPIDLDPYLTPGLNTLEFTVGNLAGYMGFDIRIEGLPWHLEKIAESLVIVSFAALFLLQIGALERWQPPVFWLTLFSLLLSGVQYFSSLYYEYALDIPGHIAYILQIAHSLRLPPPFGWHYQQPPLYYIAMVPLYKIGQWLGMAQPIYAVRLASTVFYISFLWISMETIHLYLRGRYVLLAAAIVLFWPDGFTYAGRISNDGPILTLNALTLYLVTRWYMENDALWLRYAWYSALVGLAIKSSAMVSLGFVGGMTLLALWRKQIQWRFLLNPWIWSIGGLSVLSNFGRILYYRVFEHMDVRWFINIDLTTDDIPIVRTVLPYFFYLDISHFIGNPFYRDNPGGADETFWTPFFKTLLYGEWEWQAVGSAHIVSILFLLILLLILVYLFRWGLLQRGQDYEPLYPPLILLASCMIGAVMWARVQVPWVAQCNARYVCGIVVLMGIYLAKSVEWHMQQRRFALAYLSTGVAIAFSVLSVLMLLFEFDL